LPCVVPPCPLLHPFSPPFLARSSVCRLVVLPSRPPSAPSPYPPLFQPATNPVPPTLPSSSSLPSLLRSSTPRLLVGLSPCRPVSLLDQTDAPMPPTQPRTPFLRPNIPNPPFLRSSLPPLLACLSPFLPV